MNLDFDERMCGAWQNGPFSPSNVHGLEVTAGTCLQRDADKNEERGDDEGHPAADPVGKPHGDEAAEKRACLDNGYNIGGQVGENDWVLIVEVVVPVKALA